jgi:hypothetical protein
MVVSLILYLAQMSADRHDNYTNYEYNKSAII